ncbi:MAG: hypothetical protein E7387_04395 [Ruminococcaceae bacterium]|nr:hypothetical protein [Oscillospiraceae bacterium]
MDNDNLNENIINEETATNEPGITVKEIPVESVAEIPVAEEVSVQDVSAETEAPVQEPAEETPEKPAEIPAEKVVREESENYTPLGMQEALAMLEPTFFQKLSTTLSERGVLGGLLIYILFIANLIGTTIFAIKSGLGFTQSILYMFHIDSISFSTFTFTEINVLVSYIFSFICGGLVIFIFLRLGYLICKLCKFIYSHKVTRIILLAFIAVFLAGSIILFITGNGLLSVSMYKWFMPLLAFCGGFCMYCISLRNVEIY